jgi:hypothetical protein
MSGTIIQNGCHKDKGAGLRVIALLLGVPEYWMLDGTLILASPANIIGYLKLIVSPSN